MSNPILALGTIVRVLLYVGFLSQLCDVGRAQTKPLVLHQQTVDANPPSRPWYKMVGDVNQDGFVDLIVGGAKGPLVAYIYPNWKKVTIAEGGWSGVNGEIADVDGDGDPDIVMGGVVWFANPSDGAGPWIRHRIDNFAAHDIELADLDGNGRLDVVARDQSAFGKNRDKIYVYHQQPDDEWNRYVINCPHGEGLKLTDLDGDRDPDIVIGARWYENPGIPTARWIDRRYTSLWTEPDAKVEAADINGDGRTDIVLAPAELKGEMYKVCWYEAPKDRKSSEWVQHLIVKSIECVIHSLGTGDLDGDGDVDVVIAEMHQGEDPDEVLTLLNDDRGTSWRRHVLSNHGSHDIVLADVDNDGDLDIIGANHDGVHPLELWRNVWHAPRADP